MAIERGCEANEAVRRELQVENDGLKAVCAAVRDQLVALNAERDRLQAEVRTFCAEGI